MAELRIIEYTAPGIDVFIGYDPEALAQVLETEGMPDSVIRRATSEGHGNG